MNATTSKYHNWRHWGNVVLPQHVFNWNTGIHSQRCVSYISTVPTERFSSWKAGSITAVWCHAMNSWQEFWRKTSYNINEKASVFQQWLPVPGGKPIFRATWFLLGLSNQNKALLRPEDTILTNSTSRLMLHTPQGNTAGIVKSLTLNILTNNQVQTQVKRKWVIFEVKAMGSTHYQQSNICTN